MYLLVGTTFGVSLHCISLHLFRVFQNEAHLLSHDQAINLPNYTVFDVSINKSFDQKKVGHANFNTEKIMG